MPIQMVRNNTGGMLELWNGGQQLANLPNGGSIINLPITITSVTLQNVGYHNRQGGFVNNDSYLATFQAARPGSPAMVVFTGNSGVVTFS
jgi:hypothetical protein